MDDYQIFHVDKYDFDVVYMVTFRIFLFLAIVGGAPRANLLTGRVSYIYFVLISFI